MAEKDVATSSTNENNSNDVANNQVETNENNTTSIANNTNNNQEKESKEENKTDITEQNTDINSIEKENKESEEQKEEKEKEQEKEEKNKEEENKEINNEGKINEEQKEEKIEEVKNEEQNNEEKKEGENNNEEMKNEEEKNNEEGKEAENNNEEKLDQEKNNEEQKNEEDNNNEEHKAGEENNNEEKKDEENNNEEKKDGENNNEEEKNEENNNEEEKNEDEKKSDNEKEENRINEDQSEPENKNDENEDKEEEKKQEEEEKHERSEYSLEGAIPPLSMYTRRVMDATKINDYLKEDSSKGRVGGRNLGNTCFMNSSIACLSNCTELTYYFLKGDYLKDINEENTLGMRGELAREWGKLMKEYWVEDTRVGDPSDFKYTIGRKAERFRGYGQQDSNEFMSVFLDYLNEDLNKTTKKEYVELKEKGEDETDEQCARRFWEINLRRNDSIVTDLFCGQFKSTITCPDCDNINITFDPFDTINLPLLTQVKKRGGYYNSENVEEFKFFYVPKNVGRNPICLKINNISNEEKIEKVIERIKKEESFFYHDKINAANLLMVDMLRKEKYGQAEKNQVVRQFVYDEEYIFSFDYDPKITNIQLVVYFYKSNNDKENKSEIPRLVLCKPDDTINDIRKQIYFNLRKYILSPFLKENEEKDEVSLEIEKYMEDKNNELPDDKLYEIIEEEYNKVFKNYNIDEKSEDEEEKEKKDDEEKNKEDSDRERDRDDSDRERDRNDSDREKEDSDKEKEEEEKKKEDEEEKKDDDKNENENENKGSEEENKEEENKEENKEKENEKKEDENKEEIKEKENKEENKVNENENKEEENKEENKVDDNKEEENKEENKEKEENKNNEENKNDNTIKKDEGEKESEEKKEENQENKQEENQEEKPLSEEEVCKKCIEKFKSDIPFIIYIRRERDDNNYYGKTPFIDSKHFLTYSKKLKEFLETDNLLCPLNKIEKDIKDYEIIVQFNPESKYINKKTFDLDYCESTSFEYKIKEEEKKEKKEEEEEDDGKMTLAKCLKKFCKEEQLQEGDEWYCSKCKKHVLAKKKMDLYYTPKILIICFKRFIKDSYRWEKNEDEVDFPINDLDLKDFVIGPDKDHSKYDLFAVSQHYGGTGFGHYTAVCKNDGKWFSYNDSSCSETNESDAQSSAAYVLFYRRQTD